MLVRWERGVQPMMPELPDEEEAGVSVVTVSELLHGVHRAAGARGLRRLALVERVLAWLKPIPITEPVARVHARVWADLESRGELIGAHDLWIAATALTHGLTLATLDGAEFARVPGLRVISPSA